MTLKEFINSILPSAIKNQKDNGILVSTTVSQAILESWDGEKQQPSQLASKYNNYFGIKGKGTNGSISFNTKEYVNGSFRTESADFASFKSIGDSVVGYGNFLKKYSRYKNVVGASNYKDASIALQNSGYATDPNYGQKIRSIIESNNLQQYDSKTSTGNIVIIPDDRPNVESEGGIENLNMFDKVLGTVKFGFVYSILLILLIFSMYLVFVKK